MLPNDNPAGHRLGPIFEDADLVDAVVAHCWRIISAAGVGAQTVDLDAVKQALRDEFSGRRVYVRRRRHKPQDLAQKVLESFNGQNATQIARELGCSRATVYRLLKQPGGARD